MLAKCCECGKEISTDARRCPNCGYDYRDEYDIDGYINDYVDDGSGYRRLSRRECQYAREEGIKKYLLEEKEKKEKEEKENAESLARFVFILLLAGGFVWLLTIIFPR